MAVTCTSREMGKMLELLFAWDGANQSGYFAPGGDQMEIAGILRSMTTVPASTPTANYDIALNDKDGIDVAGGALVDRHTSDAEVAFPEDGAGNIVPGGVPVLGALQMVISGQSNGSASGTLRLLIEKP